MIDFQNKIINQDCLIGLKSLPDESVDCCVTSPPYFGLRDYGVDEQVGLEETPEQFIENLTLIFSEVRRVLKKDGTLWLNIGDSYAATKGKTSYENVDYVSDKPSLGWSNKSSRKPPQGYKRKDLIGIPWMLAFALRKEGWYLRQDIIWSKPNAMPESVKDRCTKSHEYIFLLSKSEKYHYDSESIKVKSKTKDSNPRNREKGKLNKVPGRAKMGGLKHNDYEKSNKRSVWSVNTKSFKEAHFATFPQKLIEDCIKAGCRIGGVVLDPFMGAGTTAVVARKLERNYCGFEINPQYIEIAEKRLQKELGLFFDA